MLVSDNPEVLELDRGLNGVSSAHVHDFWRPIGRRDAVVDGHYAVTEKGDRKLAQQGKVPLAFVKALGPPSPRCARAPGCTWQMHRFP
jgi:hypothetical protein